MAKLLYLMNTSLDGYVEDAQGNFDFGSPDEEVNTYINELSSSYGTYLYGRKIYEGMVYWETAYAANNHAQFHIDFAKQWQAAEKIVYSRTLAEPRSARTRIERVGGEIRSVDSYALHGIRLEPPYRSGIELALRAGLVDEVQMFVWPAVIGGGKRFFPEGLRLGLELVEERAFHNGAVAVRYAVRG